MEKKENKNTFSFYNVLSWLVWGFFICWIFFMLFLLLTGGSRKPTYRVNDAVLAAVPADDPALAARGVSGDDWYCLTVDATVTASDWSPLRFEINGFDLTGNAELKNGGSFVEAEDVVFSKIAPADFTLRLYVRSPDGQAALLQALESAGFCPGRYRHGLGFVKFENHVNVPAFYLRDRQVGIRDAAAGA